MKTSVRIPDTSNVLPQQETVRREIFSGHVWVAINSMHLWRLWVEKWHQSYYKQQRNKMSRKQFRNKTLEKSYRNANIRQQKITKILTNA